jgi:dihydrofolate synthase/folylpolyglutamate synthase
VTAARQASARAVIRAAAAARSAPLYCLGADFRTRRQPGGRFAYHGIHHVWRGLATGLGGDYQVENAALALAACELLMAKAPQMTPESIRSGLAKNRWPGRLETVCEHPLVIFDGAHNLDASKHLARHLARFFHGRKITLVVGILNDKPYAAMLKHLAPLAHRIIVTRARTSRALAPETLAREAARWCPRIRIVPEVAAALRHALRRSGRDDVTLVAGSLYVVGEAKEALESKRVRLP